MSGATYDNPVPSPFGKVQRLNSQVALVERTCVRTE
nr:MAG TPA: hypothetical protein [Caudoviricetes sp.]